MCFSEADLSACVETDVPRISSRLERLVVPTMGAVTWGFDKTHATAILAMLTPFFLDSSSTLVTNSVSTFYTMTGFYDTDRLIMADVASFLYRPMNLLAEN